MAGFQKHFNYAWYIGFDLRWVDSPGGTGQMTEALKQNSIDIAVVLTDGIVKADFYWIYQGLEFQMEFLAGFVGVKQDKETLELRPEIGWAIRDIGKQGIKDDDANYKDEILNPFEPVLPK